MIEIRREVKCFSVSIQCDECGSENYEQESICLTAPPLYNYRCLSCGRKWRNKNSYPMTVYEEINNGKI